METHESGYVELVHTADWAVRVWAPDEPGLFSEAARAMYALCGGRLPTGSRRSRPVSLQAPDTESLLVAFLGELLYIAEEEGLGFDQFDLTIQAASLEGSLHGADLLEWRNEIKAVTFHNLAIQRMPGRLEVTIVFDV